MKKRLSVLVVLVAVVIACLVSLAACKKTDLIAAPTNITYDRITAVLRWNSVENADKYSVSINGAEPVTVSANSMSFTSDKAFSVGIKAITNLVAGKTLSSEEAKATFEPLPKIEALNVSETGEISWDPIEGATGYKVLVKGASTVEYDVQETRISNITEVGTINVSVRPIVVGNPSYFSMYSESRQIIILAPVKLSTVTYDERVSLLKWAAVPSAKAYELKIDGVVKSSELTETSFNYAANSNSFKVSIRPIGDKKLVFDAKSAEEKNFVWLETVKNIRVVDGAVVWDDVTGADSYVVKLSNAQSEVVVKEHSYKGLAEGTSIGVQIKAQNSSGNTDYVQWFSGYTIQRNILILKAPVLKWENGMQLDGQKANAITWDGIGGAQGYNVKMITPSNSNGVESTLGAISAPRFEADFAEVGTYYVYVQATASGTDTYTYSSRYSEPIKVIRLASPNLSASEAIISDPSSSAKGFTVRFDRVQGATGYELTRNDVEVQATTTTEFKVANVVDASVISEQKLTYGIISKASGTMQKVGNENVVTLSSMSSTATKFEITVLAMPLNYSIEGFTYKYDQVDKATGYTIDIAGKPFTEGALTFDLSKVIVSGNTAEVRVCARGNGSNILSSNFTPATKVIRLEAPKNVKIETADTSEGVISFDGPTHAVSYQIVYNNDNRPLTINKNENISKYITTAGTAVYLVSHNNNYEGNDPATGIYYMDSEPSQTYTFMKLDTPTFGTVKFTNTQLLWNAPQNINTTTFTPKYIVYNAGEKIDVKSGDAVIAIGNGNSFSSAFSGTSFDISDRDTFAGGREYSFQIKAIGDGSKYINSDKSIEVKIKKLAMPNVRRENGTYVWDSVSSAQGYRVLVDGKDVLKNGEMFTASSYNPKAAFTAVNKTYNVSVYAIGDNGVNTIDSNPFVIAQITKQLDTPEFSFGYTLEAYDPNGEIKVIITKQSPYASDYAYVVGDAEGRKSTNPEEVAYFIKPRSAGVISGYVYAKGGSFDEAGNYYLDSLHAVSKTITLLTTPNENSITVEAGAKRTLKWGTVTGRVKYEIEWTCNGQTYTAETNQSQIEIDSVKFTGNVTVKIRAVGDGTTSITGAWVEKTFTDQ